MDTWRRLCRNKVAVASLIVLAFFILLAVFADLIAPWDSTVIKQSAERLAPLSAEHIFGTDNLGRDIFARLVHGGRLSLSLGLITTLISLGIGGFLGAMAGYLGGKVDSIIMRIMDLLLCLPSILLALAIIAVLGTSIVNLVVAITIAAVPGFSRIIRSAILTVVGQEYIEAARAIGMGTFRIILTQVIPNAIGPIIVQATMAIASMIITTASLSFLGMGIQPPQPEWGAMLAEGKNYMIRAPHLVIVPGVSIILTALSLNLLGDGLRDALDPRLK
jgi:peptide/nickel transport system permease protein